MSAVAAKPVGLWGRLCAGSTVPVLTIVAAILIAWYVGVLALNAPFQPESSGSSDSAGTYSKLGWPSASSRSLSS